MREYDDITLRRVQQTELGILNDFITVCEQNSLKYFALAGTGIGALRHGGFIPWDDDIDVGLLREDYSKLIEVFKHDYSDKYIVVNGDEFSNYPLMTTRIMLKNTRFVEETLKNIKCPLGIFLDVYAFDNLAKNPKEQKKQIKGAWIYSKLLILKHIPRPVLPFKGVKKFICHFVTVCVWALLNIFCVSHDYLYKKCKYYCTKFNDTDTGFYGYFCDTDAYSQVFSKDDLFPLRYMDFEGIKVAFPNKTEKILTNMYGDYMQLPPVEKRKNHFPYELDFGIAEEISNEKV